MIIEKELPNSELRRHQKTLLDNLDRLKDRALLVIGDIGLDEYVLGGVRRISPEAPVPVVEVEDQQRRLGLAANVAQNIASLGGRPLLLGVVGSDAAADDLRRLLREANVATDHLIVDPSRPTTRKMRVMVEHHHIVRVDFEHKKYLAADVEAQLLNQVEALLPTALGVVIEDYAKGVLSESGIQKIIRLAKSQGKKVLADPNPSTPAHYYRGVTLMTPNRDEAFKLSGLNFDGLKYPSDALMQVGRKLIADLELEKLIITRGKEGMSLFSGGDVLRLPTYARQVYDVTGAGDTVIAALALGWLSGLSLEQACILANFAAGVVVGKVGCVPCSIDELREWISETGA